MAQIPTYEREFSFTGHSEDYPSRPHRGDKVDAEFDAVALALAATKTALAQIRRTDGQLKNLSVGLDQLKPEIVLGTPTDWTTATEYERKDVVWRNSVLYVCNTDHTSGTFATDLAAAYWTAYLDYADPLGDAADYANAARDYRDAAGGHAASTAANLSLAIAARAAAEAAQAAAEDAAQSIGLPLDVSQGGTGVITQIAATDGFLKRADTIVSGATVDLATVDSWFVTVTGATGPITSFGTAADGVLRLIRFTGAPTITHHATNMILPGGQSIVVAAGDTALVESLGAGAWRMLHFKRATGVAGIALDGVTPAANKFAYFTSASAAALLGFDEIVSGYLYGGTLSNDAGDLTNDIAIAAGKCVDSTNVSICALAAMTKRLDANWAAGTNQGFRYSGAAIANTTYGVWAAWTATGTQDYYAYPNSGAPTAATVLAALQAESGGSAYVYLRRIGCIIRSGGSILRFWQRGDDFYLESSVATSATNPGTAAVLRALTVPLGLKVKPILYAGVYNGTTTGTLALLVTDPDNTDIAPSGSLWTVYTLGASPNPNNTLVHVMTDTSAQVRTRLNTSGLTDIVEMQTHGWTDTRGRLAA